MQTAQLSKSVSVSWSPFLMVRTCNLLMAFFAASPRRRCGTNRDSQTEAHLVLVVKKPMTESRIKSFYCLTWCISSINVRQSVIIYGLKGHSLDFNNNYWFFFQIEVTKSRNDWQKKHDCDKLQTCLGYTHTSSVWVWVRYKKKVMHLKNLILGFKKTSVENHLLRNKEIIDCIFPHSGTIKGFVIITQLSSNQNPELWVLVPLSGNRSDSWNFTVNSLYNCGGLTCTHTCRITTLLLKPSQQSWRLCTYLISVSSVSISESLNVVEDKPGKRNDHQHDEGDGHKHHRRPADILLQVTCANGNNHGYCHIVLQEQSQLPTFWLWNHDGNYLPCPCRGRKREINGAAGNSTTDLGFNFTTDYFNCFKSLIQCDIPVCVLKYMQVLLPNCSHNSIGHRLEVIIFLNDVNRENGEKG